MTSAPALNSSSACLGVIPMPPAAFSPLTTTKSAASSARRSPSMVRSARRPAEPTTSPTKRIAVKPQTLVHRRRPAHTWHMQDRDDDIGAGGAAHEPLDLPPGATPAPAPGATPQP